MQHVVGKARTAEVAKGKESVHRMTLKWKAGQDAWLDSESAGLVRDAINNGKFRASAAGLQALEAAEVCLPPLIAIIICISWIS
jgi:hypothetical protein